MILKKRQCIYQYISVFFMALSFLCLLIIFFTVKFNIGILNLSILMIFLTAYIFSYLFQNWFIKKGESKLRFDKEIATLEKNNSVYLLSLIIGGGFAFLIPGLSEQGMIVYSVIGLVFLSLANIVYASYYLPRYNYLILLRQIELDIKKKS